MNNKIKKLIFIVTILAGFSSILPEIDKEKIKLNAVIVKMFRDFLTEKKVTQPEIKKIIQHFNNFQESIPCLQYKTSLIDKTFCTIQKALLGYSWETWKATLERKNSRAIEVKNYWVSSPNDTHQKPAAIPKNVDIKNEQISYYPMVNTQNSLVSQPDNIFCNIEKNNNITYIFRTNPIVTQQYPESYPFRRAYLLAQVEKNSQWITHRNLALAKIALGAGSSFLAYYLSQNLALAAAGGLAGILSANYLKKPIEQREHAACIQLAKQLIGSEQEFSFEPEITSYPNTISINGQKCNISAVKFKVSQNSASKA